MSYDTNPYYHPEKMGLTQIDMLDDPDACYSFNMLVVWRHQDGRLFWATDSGCSCPSPFEEVQSLDDLNTLTNENWNEFQKAVEDHCAEYDYKFQLQSPGEGWADEGPLTVKYGPNAGREIRRWSLRKPDPGNFAADKTQVLAKVSRILWDMG